MRAAVGPLCILRRVSSLRTLLEDVLARLAHVGADARDDEETRLRKALLLLISVLILPISLVWGTLYLAFGATSGYLAYLYFAILLGAIAVTQFVFGIGFVTPTSPGWNLPFAVLGGCIVLMAFGAGRWSIDAARARSSTQRAGAMS